MVRIHGEEGGFWCDAALVVMTVATLAVFGIEVVFYHKGATKHHYFVKPPLHGTLYPIWILILGLTVVLEGWALPDSLGCSSPAAYGPTISRISASILSQGYTYMLVIFVLCITSMTQASSRLKSSMARYHRDDIPVNRDMEVYDLMLTWGLTIACFTAVLPDPAHDCDLQTDGWCWQRISTKFHVSGIGLGMVLSLFGGLARARFAVKHFDHSDELELHNPAFWNFHKHTATKIGLFFLHLLPLLFIMVAAVFVLDPPKMEVHSREICINYKNEEDCNGRVLWEHNVKRDDPLAKAWPCVWQLHNDWELEASCIDPNCRKDDRLNIYKRRITIEFGLLIFWVATMGWVYAFLEHIEMEFHSGYPDWHCESANAKQVKLLRETLSTENGPVAIPCATRGKLGVVKQTMYLL